MFCSTAKKSRVFRRIRYSPPGRLVTLSFQEYYFTDEEFATCKEFSEKVDTTFYQNRSQLNAQKRQQDSYVGKLGEFAVYNLLKDKNLSLPDTKIYSAKNKSWDYDLKGTDFNCHVKTQNILQAAKFGESWIFQKGDKHIFKNYQEIDYVAFVLVDLIGKSARLRTVLPVKELHDKKLFKEPRLDYLQSKVAIYYEDLKKL